MPVTTTKTRSEQATSFFNALFQLLDAESDLVTNGETEADWRPRMRRAVKSLKSMLASAQRFHAYRFSAGRVPLDDAVDQITGLVRVFNKCSRGEPGLEFLRAIARIDERTTFQPLVFDRKFSSAARAALTVILFHYVPFDDAIESLAPGGKWTQKNFDGLCKCLDGRAYLSFQKPAPTMVVGDGNPSAIKGAAPAKVKQRGRPVSADADETQILRLWHTRDYRSYKDCANAVVSPKPSKTPLWKRVKQAVIRDNKRRSRAKAAKKSGA